ncbi:MAG: GGDEF domain-containing protein, partial [Firmicutes bacterium]|nr:GGDEF domain-containing protein [Bacillota bacterium]
MFQRKLLLIIIILMLPFWGGCSNQSSELQQTAQNGFLDLSQNNLKDEIIPLDGKWAFYWNQLLVPTKVKQGEISDYATFPSSWNKYEISGKSIPGAGYATYRLTFITSENEILALKIPKVRTAYKLWANGELIATAGTVGQTRDTMVPQYLPQVASFDALQGENEIILQISNFYRPSGGLLNSIQLGGETQLLALRYNGIAYELFLFGALMMMGIYHLALFFFRRKDPAPLYFGLFCILVAIRTLFIGEAFLFTLFPNCDFEFVYKIQTLTYYLGVPLIMMFFKSVLPAYFHIRVIKLTQFIAGIYAMVVLFTPTWIFSVINPLYQIWTIFMIGYLVIQLVKIARHKEKDSWLIVLGGLVLVLTCFIDIITLSVWIDDSWPPLLRLIFQGDANSSTGQLIFAVLYSLLLAKNFSESLEYRTVMGEKLVEMNSHLDELVLQRTKDLTESNKKVEQQNLELEQINQELQRLSLNDPLTGLWNRRKYKETASLEWQRCLNHQKPISLLFIDVDYFKNYNDLYGHVTGDECLIKIAETLKSSLALSSDMAVRYGGEEFVVLLSETGKENALKIAELFLKKIESLDIPHEGSLVKNCITVSIGVSTVLPDDHSRH